MTLDNCVESNSFDGQKVKLSKGEHQLGGRQALEFSRVRENRCNPHEDDRTRAARQQKVLSAMRSRVISPFNWPSSFIRLPLISWQAPRALRSDMGGPGLSMLFSDLLTGGGGKTQVLGFDRVNPDGSLHVVFNFMPPSWAEDNPTPFDDFDQQLSRAVGLPVQWEDREVFRIERPAGDTVARIRQFLGSYPRN